MNSHFYQANNTARLTVLPISSASHFFFITKLSSIFELNMDEFFFFKKNFVFDQFNSLSENSPIVYNDKDLFLTFQDHDFFNDEILDISY